MKKRKDSPSQEEMNEIESLYKSNKLDVLEEKTKQLISNYPNFSILFNILGSVLYKKGHYKESISNFNEAIKLNPNFYFAYNNLGNSLKALGKYQESINSYEKALKINPNYFEAYSSLGMSLLEVEKIEEAILCQKKALKINPKYADAHNNLGILLARSGKYEESIIHLKNALEIKPDYAEVYSNLGASLTEMGRYEDAIKNYQRALKLNPKYTEAHFNESTIRLMNGEFEIGWQKYEYRFDKNFITKMRYDTNKIWDGNYLNGTLLVWAEQGIGDHILFASMILDLKKYAKNIILEIDIRLVELFKRYCDKINFSNIKIVGLKKELLKDFDKHIAIGSLGRYLRKSIKSFTTTPKKYLISSSKKEEEIKKKFLSNGKFKVGISWKTLNKKQQYRNILLEQMLPILSVSNCEFINLQFGQTSEDLKNFMSKHKISIKTIDEIDNYNDIESLAALVNCLDLVITIQNSTAHLAGALGKKTWMLLAKNARWHWLVNQNKSLWYPSVKLFRQENIGDWNNIINNISIDLESLSKIKKN